MLFVILQKEGLRVKLKGRAGPEQLEIHSSELFWLPAHFSMPDSGIEPEISVVKLSRKMELNKRHQKKSCNNTKNPKVLINGKPLLQYKKGKRGGNHRIRRSYRSDNTGRICRSIISPRISERCYCFKKSNQKKKRK
ncbi:MAG: hypothetical protein UW60_C0012G0037 [Candidatus Woesebacteria bacterium GW2011_GWA2_44_33]|uniref:Uncharacterized protein n=3 Tax=Microgenomates group TaxID=1794810 RepID=A0A0G1QIW6_9BACT|nr:MAG: hypothetical protein UW60_C0012G0037 [Candidatus Woesebacteria bacterium GW2011_GWA2_44_33]KKT67830.1 MAG: hypothetical protein UW61_C0002G0008 [Candidatus Curtissbacteria bacterium GW2011_GWC1_44_33]KKU17713.1 MAG: hypothetical protein UX25_C0002G0007 [Candidatus Woesebacteria bacterium GW2011_GWC2_45_9]